MSGRLYKTLNRCIGQALHTYEMISDGDRIAVGISGGADSLTLLWFLTERLRRIPITYTLYPIYIDPGFENSFGEALRACCRDQGHHLHLEHTNHGPLSHSDDNRENPCFLCSRLRRKRLFEIAHQLGCRKLALGHHKDDIIETLFLNMCYAGELSTMNPCQPFFNGEITVIRPLAFCEKSLIRKFVQVQSLPAFTNPCPTAATSKRHEIKRLLEQLYRSNRKIKGNIFRSMRHVKLEYLLK